MEAPQPRFSFFRSGSGLGGPIPSQRAGARGRNKWTSHRVDVYRRREPEYLHYGCAVICWSRRSPGFDHSPASGFRGERLDYIRKRVQYRYYQQPDRPSPFGNIYNRGQFRLPMGNASYGAFPGQQTINVPADATTPVQVAYTVIVPHTTVTLDSQEMQNVSVSQDRSTIVFAASNQASQSLVPGSVLAVGVTPSTPNGILRKVVSVTQSGSQIVATTTQATIADAFQQANFAFSTSVDAQNAQSIKMLRPGVRLLHRLPEPSTGIIAAGFIARCLP